MLSLILAILFGLAFAWVATQNTNPVTLHAGSYVWKNIPLYIVAVGSLLTGLVLAWLLSIVNWIGSMMALHGKDVEIKRKHQTVRAQENRIHELELENARLRGEQGVVEETHSAGSGQADEPVVERKPGLFTRLKYRISA